MKISGKTEISALQIRTCPLSFPYALNCWSVFALVLFTVLYGCVTEPRKTVDEYVLPALPAKYAEGSSKNPEIPKQDTVHRQEERYCTAVRKTDSQEVNAEKQPAAGKAPGASQHNDPDLADTGKSRKKTSPQEEISMPQKPAKSLPSKEMTLRFQNEELGLLLRGLARAAGISIMLSENIKGKVTVDIQNKPWDQIFAGLLRTHGLIYEWEGDIIRIMTVEDMGQEVRELEMRQKREAQKRGIETVAPFASEVIRIDYADAGNLKEIFEKLLEEGTNGRRGSVMVDKYSNSIVVQAREKEIEAMRMLAEKLDRPTRQIRIEAQIIEANSNTARELGFEWGGYYSGSVGGSKKLWFTPGIDSMPAEGETGDSTSDSDSTGSTSTGLLKNLSSRLAGGSGLLLSVFLSDPGKYLLGLQLSALEEEGKIRILSNPSISTLDNHTALIESGMEVPYQTVEDDEVNIEFKKAVLSLEVTPHVIEDNFLKMKIITSKDELDFSNIGDTEGNPTIITKKAETNVILQDGQTMVIGGLRKEKTSAGESGVPLLKNIPLLGGLFRKEYSDNEMEELLIFITPRIVK